MDDHPATVTERIQLAGKRGGGVDHQHIAGREMITELIEPGVRDAPVVGDQQPDTVATQTAPLGRLGRGAVVR